MKKVSILLFLIVTILITSCKKDTIINNYCDKNYIPLAIGNYWIYQHYSVDTFGFETELNKMDSIFINKDTTINNKKYFILEGTNLPWYQNGSFRTYYRDSFGYLTTPNGLATISKNNFTDTLSERHQIINGDTFSSLYSTLEIVEDLVVVPVGAYNNCLNLKGDYYLKNPPLGVPNHRYLNQIYAKDIGKILETYFYHSSPIINDKRLIRFNLE